MKCCLVAAMLLVLAANSSGAAEARPADKVKLIFSLDGGMGNGVVVQTDRLAVTRICHALRPLQKRYDVYLLFNPQVADKGKLELMMGIVASQGFGMVLDVMSSDTHMLGTITQQNAPSDGVHGVSATVDEIERLRLRFPGSIAGLRIHEILAQDFTVGAIKTTNPEWGRPGLPLPSDDFYQPSIARSFVEYAAKHGLFVQWSDWHWTEFASWDKKQAERERSIREIARESPGVVTVTYANNEPNEDSVARLPYWWKSVDKFAKDGAAGYGLSDQSWMRGDTTCPVKDMIDWAESALRRGCRLIQFEPPWYYFRMPRGEFGVAEYKSDPAWADRGTPNANFAALEKALME